MGSHQAIECISFSLVKREIRQEWRTTKYDALFNEADTKWEKKIVRFVWLDLVNLGRNLLNHSNSNKKLGNE